MENYLPIRRTQAFLLHKVALFIKNSKDDFILFKGEGQEIPGSLLAKEALPEFYILRSCQAEALTESQNRLNRELYRKIRGNGLIHIKRILCELVDEALRSEAPFRLGGLPETVEILFKGFAKKVDLLAKLAELSTKHHTLKEHSVNVMVFALNYCFSVRSPKAKPSASPCPHCFTISGSHDSRAMFSLPIIFSPMRNFTPSGRTQAGGTRY